ncbi:MAG: CDP-alcohol phosphatidyltransferase family protein [Myxococcota bacterium]|nr:CDP-alcohol phosphatidyltransferase family protein [Myxococcota bacterium]
MIDNSFREVLPRFVGPLLRLYARMGLTPDGVSLLGFGFAAVAGLLILADWPLAAIVAWWIGRLCDGTDGIFARETGRSSSFGAYFDIVLDMAAYSLIVLALDQVHPEFHDRWLVILFLYVVCIASALALGMQEATRGAPARDDRGLRLGAGLAEGGETGIAYTLFLLFPAQLGILTAIWIAALAITVAARTLLARRSLGD